MTESLWYPLMLFLTWAIGYLALMRMRPRRFYFIRHGETEWNADGREQGQLDSPLTARGVRQAVASNFDRRLLGLLQARIQLALQLLGRLLTSVRVVRLRDFGRLVGELLLFVGQLASGLAERRFVRLVR